MLLTRVPRLSLAVFTLIAALLLLLASTLILSTETIRENALTVIDGPAHLHKSLQPRSDYSPPSESTDENDYDDDDDIEMGDDDDDDDYASSSSGDAERGPLAWDEYARKGALAAEYLKASDLNVVADLVRKGKLPQGSGLASRFTDVRELAANGWAVRDVTQRLRDGFEQYVPFRDALTNLGLSDSARPEGKNEFVDYEHTLIWHKDGQEMEVTLAPSLRQLTCVR